MKLIRPNTNKFHFDNIYSDSPLITNNFSIYQIGDLLCENDTIVEDHVQQFDLELSFISEGKGDFFTNNIKTIVEQGYIYISFKDDIHRIQSDNMCNLRYYYIAFNIKEDSPYYIILNFLQEKYHSPNTRDLKIEYIFPLMTNILYEILNNDVFSIEMIESNLIQILISLYRHHNNNLPIYTADLQKGIVYNIVNYIDSNFIVINNLKELAEKFFYNYSYLSKIFKIVMGKTMKGYLQEKKLNHAKLLLKENNTITQTSEILGYSSVHNFSRAFKNQFNISPQEFIKNNESKNR